MLKRLFRSATSFLTDLKLRATLPTRVTMSTDTSFIYKEVNGKVRVLRVNGEDIDPESPQGKKLVAKHRAKLARAEKGLKKVEVRMTRMGEELEEMGREMEEALRDDDV